MSFWQEVVFGVLMLVVGLFLEDWIDGWRGRNEMQTSGTFPELTKPKPKPKRKGKR